MTEKVEALTIFNKKVIIKDGYLYFYLWAPPLYNPETGSRLIGLDPDLLRYCEQHEKILRVMIGKRKLRMLELKEKLGELVIDGELIHECKRLWLVNVERFVEVPVDCEVAEQLQIINGICRFKRLDQFKKPVCFYNSDAPGTARKASVLFFEG